MPGPSMKVWEVKTNTADTFHVSAQSFGEAAKKAEALIDDNKRNYRTALKLHGVTMLFELDA